MGEVIKKCSKCGAIMEREDGLVLTSIPPKYRYICSICGKMETDTYPPTTARVVENERIVKGVSIPDEWDNFRREAAKDAMCAMITATATDSIYPEPDEICCMAICYADELIKQLKEEKEK